MYKSGIEIFASFSFGIDVSNGARNPRWVNVYRNRTHALENFTISRVRPTINVCALVNVLFSRYMPSNAFCPLRRFLDSVSWNKSRNGRPAYQFFPSEMWIRGRNFIEAHERENEGRRSIDLTLKNRERAQLFSLSLSWSNGTSINARENYISFGRKI